MSWGVVPVKYSRELTNTIFSDHYKKEKYSVYLDNINLLYVAMTRAKEVLYSFSVDNPRSENTIAGILKNAVSSKSDLHAEEQLDLNSFYNDETKIFEYGEMPENKVEKQDKRSLISSGYDVSQTMESLKLKLHGENYFSSGNEAIRKKINYGKLMHEVFEGINTSVDIPVAVRKLVLEGKITEEESNGIEKGVDEMIRKPIVSDWFAQDIRVLTEAGILLPSGLTRRPDRVIFKDGKATIIDFKFGEENPHYAGQIDLYRNLLIDMGYNNIEGFIWYVDKDKIVSA